VSEKVRVGGLRGYKELVKRLGGDPKHFTRACGIPDGLLDDEDALIPYRQLIHLMETTATKLGVPDFGLRLASDQDIGILGPLAVAMQNSETVEQALRCAATHLFVQSPALSLDIEELTSSTRLRLNINLRQMPHQAMCQAEDLGIGVVHGVLTLLAQDHYALVRVEVPHRPLSSPSMYEEYFGAPVSFDCACNALYCTRETLHTSLLYRSEQLHKMAEEYLNVHASSPDGLVAARVETAIRKTLGTDSCNRELLARAMAMHPRTLQRRLKQENTSFDDIRDRIRRETAGHYLRHTNMPLSQVAGLVGYAEQAILSRSCQRWFGQSPRRVRNAASGYSPDLSKGTEIATRIVSRSQINVSKGRESAAQPGYGRAKITTGTDTWEQ
jgi:AraC-like DNA-binding protein